jgi:hypothetical protein
MFGHDYGVVVNEEESNFWILLLGRSEKSLQSAWQSMASGIRKMLPLSS